MVDRDLSRPGRTTPTLDLPGEVRVRAGETTKVRVRVDRDGGSEPVTLRFEGAPRGVSVDGPTIPADVQETEVVVSAAPDAPPSVADLGVSAIVGDRRAEARVRLSVLPSEASEAYSRGRDLLARGERARAIEAFSKAIEHDPGHAWAYCFRAITTHLTGRPATRSPITPRRSGSIRTSTSPTGPGAAFITRRAISPGRWRITTRRSGSSPTTRSPSAPEAGSTPTWASMTAPWRTSAR